MRRDAVALQAGVTRRPFYFGESGSECFGWYHEDAAAPSRGAVAVICAPWGSEYTRAHRTLRHLADRLARSGIAALRFDYHGAGDSPGDDLDPERVSRWIGDIRSATAMARELSGHERLFLVGVRLGATLAALASRELEVDRLVLWNPCVSGRRYVRELQAIALSAAQPANDDAGTIECAGFTMSAQTAAAVRELDLTREPVRVRERVLLVWRDDLAPDELLPRRLESSNIPFDAVSAPGWAGMLAEHQFTVVPDAALATIVAWLETAATGDRPRFPGRRPAARPAEKNVVCPRFPAVTFFHDGEGRRATVGEAYGRFGEEDRLFGILSRASADPDRPVVLLFNAGAVHHVGPNRIYVSLARSLAALGFACLRFDLEGLGDSVAREGRRENHPYPDSALADVRAAVEFLKRHHGYSRFIALGLCSGAWTAFHTGISVDDEIAELVLINPLTFYWNEGMSLETVNNYADAQAYRRSARDPARWMKLLRGQVNVKRLLDVAWAQSKALARGYLAAMLETFSPARAPRLSRDLRRILGRRRRVSFFIAEGDPGREILMAGARRTATQAMRTGQITIETIAGGDHTFSRARPREALLAALATHLRPHLRPRDGSDRAAR